MKKTLLASLAMGVLSLCVAGGASATTVTTVSAPTYTLNGTIESVATGSDMAGMQVTATFSNGDTETVSWASTGTAGSGEAVGSAYNWSLMQSGDTFSGLGDGSNPWTLSFNTNVDLTLQSIEIDAISGNAVFDTYFGDANGTPGSMWGRFTTDPDYYNEDPSNSSWATDFVIPVGFDQYDGYLAAIYSSEVAVGNANAVGDIYRYLTLNFTDTFGVGGGGFGNGDQLMFVADTDLATPVPLPSALLLFGTGLAGLAGTGLRKKKTA